MTLDDLTREVTFTRILFVFQSYATWCSKARSWFANCGVRSNHTLCVDAKGRVCVIGGDFMRADKEGAFPVTVYEI